MTKHTAAQPLDLDKLEALAKAATPGPWDVNQASAMRNGRLVVDELYVYSPDKRNVAIAADIADPATGEMSKANADFIAAANPATILALIAQARTSRLDTPASASQSQVGCERTDGLLNIQGASKSECVCLALGTICCPLHNPFSRRTPAAAATKHEACGVNTSEDARDAARYRILRQNVRPADINLAMTRKPPAGLSSAERIDFLCDLYFERRAATTQQEGE